MTTISRDDVLHLAQLSKLQLNEAEVISLASEITAILGYVELLDELATEGVEPSYQVTGLTSVGREDEITVSIKPENLLSLAPSKADNQVKVPKVL